MGKHTIGKIGSSLHNLHAARQQPAEGGSIQRSPVIDAFRSPLDSGLDQRLAFTGAEAAGLLGISKRSLIRLELRGLIRSSKALRTRLYPRTELERFLKSTT